MQARLTDIYNRLLATFGPQRWWPADSPFEVIIGAILTQNTNWQNVEKAITNLRAANAISVDQIDQLRPAELENLIRPSGFFRQKTERLQIFTRFLRAGYDGELEQLFSLEDDALRRLLLDLPGIGPETADSILLYAAGRPSFVVDAYTQRIFQRLGLVATTSGYEETRAMFMQNLPSDADLFNEYHALIVRLAKEHCRKNNPLCSDCPLASACDYAENTAGD
jgi:endonuclease-3 related protein